MNPEASDVTVFYALYNTLGLWTIPLYALIYLTIGWGTAIAFNLFNLSVSPEETSYREGDVCIPILGWPGVILVHLIITVLMGLNALGEWASPNKVADKIRVYRICRQNKMRNEAAPPLKSPI